MWYYGVRYAKNCKPSDLFTIYYTSSKHVKSFIESNGLPDIIEIRKIFNNIESARNWEHKVLKRMNAVCSHNWLNRFDGKAILPEDAIKGAKAKKPFKINDARYKLISERMKKSDLPYKNLPKMNSPEAKEKRKNTVYNNLSNITLQERKLLTTQMSTKECRDKAKKTRERNFSSLSLEEQEAKRKYYSKSIILGHKKSSYIHANDIDRNNKISNYKKTHNPNFTNLVTCEYCNKTGQYAAMKRWHFSNCKFYSV